MTPFGARGLRFAIPPGTDRRALFAALRALPGVVDVVLTEELGLVVGSDEGAVAGAIARAANDGEANAALATPPRVHVVPVVYDGEDLEEVARRCGVTTSHVVRAHTDHDHDVAMLGFLPGFAYLRGVDPRLALARRESPRTRVPAGSVAIAAGYTGIYPFASPGGWHLLGRTARFSPWSEHGAALAIGDRVRFEPVDPADPRASRAGPEDASRGRDAGSPRGAHLVVTRVAGLALVVDGGRPGHMHEGVPPGGPHVVAGLARANAALGNAPVEAAIELHGSLSLTARGGRVRVADDRAGARMLDDGETLTLASDTESRARYVAVPSGFDVPEILGGRGTLLVATLGGLDGRALRKGDALAPLGDPLGGGDARVEALEPADASGAIAVTLGPDAVPPEATRALLSGTFRISPASDRTGTRLEAVDAATEDVLASGGREHPSGPMIRGAIELTPRGLIVLGADHPTTGGYPVIAVVDPSSLDCFFARPIGAVVRFRM